MKAIGYAAKHSFSSLKPYEFERNEPLENEVQIQIAYCGVCHSDVHQVKNEWKNTIYPCLPGHEIIGRVQKIGSKVTKFKVGDRVGVGCMVDSCHVCDSCKDGLEQYCESEVGFLATYNSNQHKPSKERHTNGGYSDSIVVRQDFLLRIPANLNDAAAAPLLCAGVTTYSPLRHWKVGPGSKVGVIGLGGLGHMAVKLAHAMGAHVVLFTTSPDKAADAKRLGADEVVISKNPDEMKKHLKSFDFILNTVSVSHNLDTFTELLKRDGTMCLNGVPALPHPSPSISNLIFKRRQIAGSLIGGIKETQEMLDFCA